MQTIIVKETDLPLPLLYRGKVRDIYSVDDEHLLIVTTDRISAFDVVLGSLIPQKGKILNQMTLFWFDFFKNVIKNHLITSDIDIMGLSKKILNTSRHILEGRSMLVQKVRPLSIECIVRGHITGSAWKDYVRDGIVNGNKLPLGIKQYSQLDAPIFTPSTKSSNGHDKNISFEFAQKLEGVECMKKIREISIHLYQLGYQYAKKQGIIIADTKFEFGYTNSGDIILIDEVFTPDSSRFWLLENYQRGEYYFLDKQIVRDYLSSVSNGDDNNHILPDHIINDVSYAYSGIYKRLLNID